jgi:hypothetical protein
VLGRILDEIGQRLLDTSFIQELPEGVTQIFQRANAGLL